MRASYSASVCILLLSDEEEEVDMKSERSISDKFERAARRMEVT